METFLQTNKRKKHIRKSIRIVFNPRRHRIISVISSWRTLPPTEWWFSSEIHICAPLKRLKPFREYIFIYTLFQKKKNRIAYFSPLLTYTFSKGWREKHGKNNYYPWKMYECQWKQNYSLLCSLVCIVIDSVLHVANSTRWKVEVLQRVYSIIGFIYMNNNNSWIVVTICWMGLLNVFKRNSFMQYLQCQ